MSEKIGKNSVFFSLFFQFKLIFRTICSVSTTTDHMILKLNVSFLRKKILILGHAVFEILTVENSSPKIKKNNK